MRRSPVDSTCLRSVGYDAAVRLLELEFASRAVYAYDAVPPAEHAGLLAADSHGRYFNQRIRGRYGYRLLRRPDGGPRPR